MLSQKYRDELDSLEETIRHLHTHVRQLEQRLSFLVLVLAAQRAAGPDKAGPVPEERVKRLEELVHWLVQRGDRLQHGLLAAAAVVIATLLAIVLT